MLFFINVDAQKVVVIFLGLGVDGPIRIIYSFVSINSLTETTISCLYVRYMVKSSLKM